LSFLCRRCCFCRFPGRSEVRPNRRPCCRQHSNCREHSVRRCCLCLGWRLRQHYRLRCPCLDFRRCLALYCLVLCRSRRCLHCRPRSLPTSCSPCCRCCLGPGSFLRRCCCQHPHRGPCRLQHHRPDLRRARCLGRPCQGCLGLRLECCWNRRRALRLGCPHPSSLRPRSRHLSCLRRNCPRASRRSHCCRSHPCRRSHCRRRFHRRRIHRLCRPRHVLLHRRSRRHCFQPHRHPWRTLTHS
jgi:hypothetical protein